MSELLTTTVPDGSMDDRSILIEELVARFTADPRLVHVHREPSRAGRTAEPVRPLRPEVELALPVGRLWEHQRRSIDLLDRGHSTVIATGTGSGKSLCYQVIALEAALRGATSLFVFPTKALAHDQLVSLASWAPRDVVTAAYDGDCSPTERTWVRNHAGIVLTNPEMLHLGILANHRRWERLLRSLRLVVVDEAHAFRGIFGSHVAHVLRRLRRLVALYSGAEPTFAFTSATIGDPAGLASSLCGVPVTAVLDDGAPSAPRTTLLWNPFGGSPEGDRAAASLDEETATVATEIVRAGLRTLVFCRSRRSSELVAQRIRRNLASAGRCDSQGFDGRGPAPEVRSYRSGYLSEERREIERALGQGELGCVVATSALELGVDVAGLDAVVLSGYPGTTSSFRQQLGRVGRGTDAALAVLVAGEDQLDQWMMHHPLELFGRHAERAVVNPSNPQVLLPQLACAADESPLRRADSRFWPEDLDEGVRLLVNQDRVQLRSSAHGPVACWAGRGAPAPTVGLRSSSRGEYAVRRTDGSLLATVDTESAFATVHPGAVYMHQGTAWRVQDLDTDSHQAVVERCDGSSFTHTLTDTRIRLGTPEESTSVGSVGIRLGPAEVTSRVTGYVERSVDRGRILHRSPLELPPSTFDTTALWWTFPPEATGAARVDRTSLPGALHAVEHAAIGILGLFTICDRWDVGGISSPRLGDEGLPTVVVHDGRRGGSGVAAMAYSVADAHLRATLEVIEACACRSGCPGCVQSPKCGSGNRPLDKPAAERLLGAALGG